MPSRTYATPPNPDATSNSAPLTTVAEAVTHHRRRLAVPRTHRVNPCFSDGEWTEITTAARACQLTPGGFTAAATVTYSRADRRTSVDDEGHRLEALMTTNNVLGASGAQLNGLAHQLNSGGTPSNQMASQLLQRVALAVKHVDTAVSAIPATGSKRPEGPAADITRRHRERMSAPRRNRTHPCFSDREWADLTAAAHACRIKPGGYAAATALLAARTPDPGPTADREAITKLARQLDLPVRSLPREQRPKTTIWHCSVRTAADDRLLTDDEWATVARRIVHAAGIAPEGDPKACRWIAGRHAPDHIHIAATLVREDGRTARRNFDKRAVQTEARATEKDYGLRELHPGDGTAAKRATSAERRKADRCGLESPARDQLRDAVRRALAGAAKEEDFFHRRTAQGVRITKRVAPSGDVTGFTVALPSDRNRDGKPIWFSGSKLAPDLSLPRIRERLAATPTPSDGITDPARARRTGTTATADALRSLAQDDDGSAADQLTGIGEVLDALAQTSAAPTRTELQAAARTFERATRSHIQAANAHNQALRKAARDLIQSGQALGRGEDGAATAMLLSVLITAAVMAAHWHAARGHAQQAAASRQTAAHLRVAYESAATTPLTTMRATGQTLPALARHQAAATVQAVLPAEAARIQAEPNWPALAATLTEAAQAGHDPVTLLHRAVDNRELTTADSLTDVLLWRLRHKANLPAAPTYPGSRPSRRPTPPLATPAPPLSSHTPTRRR